MLLELLHAMMRQDALSATYDRLKKRGISLKPQSGDGLTADQLPVKVVEIKGRIVRVTTVNGEVEIRGNAVGVYSPITQKTVFVEGVPGQPLSVDDVHRIMEDPEFENVINALDRDRSKKKKRLTKKD